MNLLRIAVAALLLTPWQALAQVRVDRDGPRGGNPGGGGHRMPPGGGRDNPRPQPRPQPPVNRPQPRPQPPVNRPNPTPRPQPPVNRPNPTPNPRPQPPVNRPNPTPNPRPQPPVNRPNPTPNPRPQPPVNRPNPTPNPRPQPPVNRPNPTPNPRPQPPVNRPNPTPNPRPQPPVNRPNPTPNPRPQPPVNRPNPTPNPRPQPPVNRPNPTPNPRPQPPVNRPTPPSHNRPGVRPQPGHGRLPNPNPIADPVRDGRMGNYPVRDDRGGHLGERHWSHAPNRDHIHRTIGNVTIINHIHGRVGTPNLVRGRHYWYYDNGMRRSHYYDHNGLHWFGFYLGDVYFWTRWHNNRLWWNDAAHGRWLYHDAGYWWWVNGGVVFIYRDGAYHRWQSSRGGYRAEPEAPAEEKVEFYSEDGSRLVRVYGDKKEGFLYDNTPEEPAYLAYLGTGVEEVQFNAQNIVVTAKDEQGAEVVRLYTKDGQETGPQDSVSPEGQLKDSPAFNNLESQAPRR